MEQKRVSFEVAKAIKEAGFLQPKMDVQGYVSPCTCYFTGKYKYYDAYRERKLEFDEINELHTESDWNKEDASFYGDAVSAPTYLDAWLWLWKVKGIEIWPTGGIILHGKGKLEVNNLYNYPDDPEEVIIASIEWLVKNDLIK